MENMKDTVVVYGCFDGVHQGHIAVAKKAVEIAKEKGLTSVVVSIPKDGKVLSTEEEKEYLFKGKGVQEFVSCPSDNMAEKAFVKDILVGKLGAKVIVVGETHANVEKVTEASRKKPAQKLWYAKR